MHLKHKKHEFITIVLFGLLIVGASFFYSNDAITGFVTFNTEGKQPWKGGNTLVTHYYIPKENEMDVWSVTNNPNLGSTAACNVKYDTGTWGFYEEVKCQGTGFSSNENCKYRYYDIQTTKQASPCHPLGGSFIPTPYRTIAAPSDLTKGTEAYIYFGPEYDDWNGCYVVEDRGSAIKGNHIDLFVGTGKEALESTDHLPRRADIYIGCEGIEPIPPGEEISKDIDTEIEEDSSGSYEFTPKFSAETEFDLNDYDIIIKQAKLFMEKMDECAQEEWIDTGEPKPVYYGINSAVNYEKTQVSDLDACVSEHLPERWELDCENLDNEDDNIFMFCVPLDYYVKIYDSEENKVEEKQIVVKFALEFKEYEQTVDATCSGTEGKYSYSCVDMKQDCEGEITESFICQEGYCCKEESDCKEKGEICFSSDECCSGICVIDEVSHIGAGSCE